MNKLNPIPLTDAERETGLISRDKQDRALEELRVQGFTALLNVAAVAHLEAVRHQMVTDIERWNETAPQPLKGGNFTPSRQPELLFKDILMNPVLAALLGEFIGREVTCGMYSSNVTVPGRGDQELHVDRKPDQVGDDLSLPCRSVIVNFPLVDFTAENGATELWPCSHHSAREPGENTVSRRLQEQHGAKHAPVLAELPRGAALIRDSRLWHRGTTNRCDYVRPMIALIFDGGFRPGVDPLTNIPSLGPIPSASRAFFEDQPAIYYNPEFVDEPIVPRPGHLAAVVTAVQGLPK